MKLDAYRKVTSVVLVVTSILLIALMFNSKYPNQNKHVHIKKFEQNTSYPNSSTDDLHPYVKMNIIMMKYNHQFHEIYAAGLEYQLNKHFHDYHCTPNCSDGSTISISIDHVYDPKYLTTMDNNSNYWIHYQTEQCSRGTNDHDHKYFPLGQKFPDKIDLLLDWSQRYVSMKDNCYPHVKRAVSLNFDATIDPIYLYNSINYFKNITASIMNFNHQTFDQLHDIDVALFGTMGDPRKVRPKFCDSIKNQYPTLEVDCAKKFADELINKLKRSKVCINLHFYPQASLETHRINQCILWKVAVVSERSGDPELDRKYEQEYGVTFVDFIHDQNDKNGLGKFIDEVKQLIDDKQRRFQVTEMAFENMVKLNQEKNEQICQIAKSIKCHYPKS